MVKRLLKMLFGYPVASKSKSKKGYVDRVIPWPSNDIELDDYIKVIVQKAKEGKEYSNTKQANKVLSVSNTPKEDNQKKEKQQQIGRAHV